MTPQRKPERFGHICGIVDEKNELVRADMHCPPVTSRRVRTPRFRCNAPLAWLMWRANPKASTGHRRR